MPSFSRERPIATALLCVVAGCSAGDAPPPGVVADDGGSPAASPDGSDDGARDAGAEEARVDAPPASPCGNGRLDPGEACDDGDTLDDGDGCSATCQRSGACGDGVRQRYFEECDLGLDGGADAGAACDAACHGPLRWIAVDPHVHDTCSSTTVTSTELVAQMMAHGISVASLNLWGGQGMTELSTRVTGADDPASTPSARLRVGIELSNMVASAGGHLLLLDVPAPLGELAALVAGQAPTLRSGLPISSWNRAQASPMTIGVAHTASFPADAVFPDPIFEGLPVEAPIAAALGWLDFLAIELNPGMPVPAPDGSLYLRLWKAGIVLPLAASSDFPCGGQYPGSGRTYALVEGPLDVRSAFAALRAGRVVAAAGDVDRVDLTIGDARVGDEIAVASGAKQALRLETTASHATSVDVWVGASRAISLPVPEGHAVSWARLAFDRSTFVFARTDEAQTSPIRVTVDGGAMTPDHDEACTLAKWVTDYRTAVNQRRFPVNVDIPLVMDASARARDALIARAGGACP